jgi:hypothetical protein
MLGGFLNTAIFHSYGKAQVYSHLPDLQDKDNAPATARVTLTNHMYHTSLLNQID